MGTIRSFYDQAKSFDLSFIDPKMIGKGITLGFVIAVTAYAMMKDKTVVEIKDIIDDIVGIAAYDWLSDIGGQQMSMITSVLGVVFGAGNTIADMIIETEDDGTGTEQITSTGWIRIAASLVVLTILVVAGAQRYDTTEIRGLLS